MSNEKIETSFDTSKARPEQEAGYAPHLSHEGENLTLVIQYLYQHHNETFDKIIELLRHRVPVITHVDSKITEEGRVLLKFQDGPFADLFLARYVSDGTIKMLAEEFRAYSQRGGQVFVLIHSPDFLNATQHRGSGGCLIYRV